MDQRERLNDPEEATRVAQDGHQARIWTSLPGIIQSYDPAAMTAVVQVAVQGNLQGQDGSLTPITPTIIEDVPVEFPSGGGFTLTFPIAADDECVIEFQARCIDSWWQSGGIQPQAERRMHDFSDAICRVGPRSKPRVLTGLSNNSVQLRSDDGAAYVEVKAGHLVNIVAPGGVNINGVTIDTNGNMVVPGTLQSNGNSSLSGGAKKVVLDGDPVSGGVVHASSTKTTAT